MEPVTEMPTISPTLAINEEIARRRAAGQEVIALGFGEASIPVHPMLIKKLGEHGGAGAYGPVAGTPELRAAAAGYWTRRELDTEADQVIAGPGSKPLLYAIFQAIGGPIALPKPSWVSYAAQTALLGIEAPMIKTSAGNGGVPDPALLDTVASEAERSGRPLKAVLVTTPDNPTGTVASPETIKSLCEVAEAHDLMIISDEIYRDLVHDEVTVFRSAADLAPDRTIVTTGLSKSLALGGWRIGYARFPATDDGRRLQAVVTTAASEIWSAPAHPVQDVAAWAMTEPAELVERVHLSQALHGRIARAVAKRFADAGAVFAPPTAAFYLYPDFSPLHDQLRERHSITTSPELAAYLLAEHGVATLPGTAFGDDPDRLALRIATPMLHGPADDQREQALHDQDPAALPWIAADLDKLAVALTALTRD